jgi:serine/threonine protein kinase
MPVYEGNLQNLLDRYRPDRKDVVQVITDMMLSYILLALEHVHRQRPLIIHRDIKPANILYQGYNFFLTDFGIAKTVDTSRTVAGTRRYLAPEFGGTPIRSREGGYMAALAVAPKSPDSSRPT